MDPDNRSTSAETVPQLAVPTDGWQGLIQAFDSTDGVFSFSNAQIISYFVTRTADDGLPMGDFKSVNNSAANLFRCGHVQQIQVAHDKSDTLFVRADCLPDIKLKLSKRTFDICGATCGCPAGKGPKASCKHMLCLGGVFKG